MTLKSGARLGPYEIVSRIGAGGMGEVFRARDTRLDRTVAVKILPAGHATNSQLRLRFEREAKAISALNHPHICSLYDVGRESDVDFLVMEYIDGESLADRLMRGPLPIDDAIRYGIEIADALDRAHRQGIVHRDLKPGNVMLTRGGVKLLDFGLARSVATNAPSPDDPTMAAKPLTEEGAIIGTFQYMAPEQLEGLEADARTDIFAFGAVLYEMATGKRAFDGKTRTSVIAAIVAGTPRPLAELQPLTPRAFEFVVARCLDKDRETRWQSAHDIKLELLRIAQGNEEVAAQKPRSSRAAWIVAALMTLLALGGIGTAIRASRAKDARAVRAFLLPPPSDVMPWKQLTSLSISRDGRLVTFRGSGSDERLYVRSIAADDAHPVSGTEGGVFPFWSPDGKWIAFFTEAKLKKVALNGAPPVTICSAPRGRSGAWLNDGTILFSPSAETSIHRVSAAGGSPTPVTNLDPAERETTQRWASILPDGSHFLYLAASHSESKKADQNAIWWTSLDEPQKRKLVVRTRYNAAFAAGRLYYAKQGVLVAQPFDPKSGELSGEPEKIVGDIETDDGYFKSAFDVSNDGTLVYHVFSDDSRLFQRANGVTTPIGEKSQMKELKMSPDGKRAAVTVIDDETAMSDIRLYDLESGDATPFTATPDENDGSIVWLGANQLVYTSGKGFGKDSFTTYVASLDGSSKRALTHIPKDAWATAVSPNGVDLVFGVVQQDKSDFQDLWYAPIAGGAPKELVATSAHECCATFSPDGKWFAYYTATQTTGKLTVARFPSGASKTDVPCDSRWAGEWTTNGIVCWSPTSTLLVPVTSTDTTIRFSKAIDLGVPTKNIRTMDTIDAKHLVYSTHEPTREELAIGIITPDR